MKRGGTILCSAAVAALGACGAQPALQIRPIAAPVSAQQKPVPIRIAEARVQFALGNVALALESFRKAVREDPSSTDALLGVAACYDQMARFDQSRRHYEMALAIAPGDPQLLGALALSLEQQGAADEAAAVRREIAVRLAAREAQAPVEVAAVPPPPELAAPQVAMAASEAAAPTLALAAPVAVQQPELAAEAPVQPRSHQPAASIRVADVAAAPALERADLQPLPEPVVGQSVTIDLPPPRAARTLAARVPDLPAPEPLPEPSDLAANAAVSSRPGDPGPRLERLSMGVVALVTDEGPRWESKTLARSDRSTTVRFVPLREANARPARVRILNAARVNRLAARTRNWLTARGWAEMPIGDAPATRSQSLVVYPAGQRELAQTLANQFGFAMEERSNAKFVTMLLGRDASRIEELRPKNA